MIKTPLKLLSLFLLLIISFIYTSKVTESALESDPVMKSIEKYKIKNDIEPVEPIIKENEMILGYSGLIIDKKASYKNMKEFNVFDENYKFIKSFSCKDEDEFKILFTNYINNKSPFKL
jgi:hypothetical protein